MKIFRDHRIKVEHLNYVFCTDRHLRKINKQYLNHDFNTDILTFDLSTGKRVIADVFISVERASINAKLYQVSRLSEIRRLLIHGALHLCGHEDLNRDDQKKMRDAEDFYLNKLFVSRET